jgi:hypothetical protein
VADDIDDDTVLSALLPIDRTVVSGGGMPVDEQTVLTGPGGELDEKTRAVERRALNTSGGVSDGGRVAFAPAERRERYPVRTEGTALSPVTRFDVRAPAPRAPLRPRRPSSGAGVLVAVVIATLAVAAIVGGILMVVLRQ